MAKSPFLKPFPAAIAFFAKKLPIPTENWKTISEEYQAIAFTVASITRLSLLADIKKIIENQLESGISPEAFREQFRDAVIRAGWNPQFSPYRINLILSQNARTSYSFGRWEQQEDPAFKQRHPYRIWRHRDSVVPRPHHLAQDGKVYPADADVWRAIAPPPFGCKCSFYSLSQRQLETGGLTVSKPPKLSAISEPGFTKGYPKNLDEQREQLVADAVKRLPPNLARLLQEDVEFQESRKRPDRILYQDAFALNFAYNPNQPRDEQGRFGKKGAHPIAKGKISPDRMSREEIAAYIDDVSSRAARRIDDTSQGDWFLRELARDQDFDGLPHIVTKQEMDKYVANGERELFRGLDSYGMRGKTGEDLAEQFRSGDLYVGKGIFGNGIYVAYGSDKSDAEGYTGIDTQGAILRMSLKPDARIISYDKLLEEQNKDFVKEHPELEDIGRYAAFKGYDVIDVGATKNQPKYMVILNRTATRVQNESIIGELQ